MVWTVLAIAALVLLVLFVAGIGAHRPDDATGRGGSDLRDEVRRLRESTDRLERAAHDAETAARRADDDVRALRREVERMRGD